MTIMIRESRLPLATLAHIVQGIATACLIELGEDALYAQRV